MMRTLLIILTLCIGWLLFGESPAVKKLTDKLPFGHCSRPLVFHLGGLDSRFELDAGHAEAILQEAAEKWNRAAGKEILKFDAAKGFPVNFVFDQRQQSMMALKRSVANLNEMRLQLEFKKQVLQQEIDVYEERRNDYQQEVTDFNSQVSAFNRAYQHDDAEAGRLRYQADSLKIKQANLNDQHSQLDTQKFQLQMDADTFNQMVQQHNQQYGGEQEFTQRGVYKQNGSDKRVEIYQFNDDNDLLLVAVHELGHALGLEHLPAEHNIMSASHNYSVEENSTEPQLTADDVAAVKAVCRL
ncbi:matrixin family metalloprotease [Stenoxybacter acetivorans]|uniref:matrixin family metalloprotease n=1 Tax=Stenoxybacter acetivorans TaxID=422441 RepID=UPI00055BEB37|nr:matrixin family metalloprotease [Stenoxybacter acetivorans]